MKFMKLGSRPDTFYTTEAVRSVSSEVSSDLIVQVKGTRYLLHKITIVYQTVSPGVKELAPPEAVLGKSRILAKTNSPTPDLPGGDDAFELCAKFCYGITITLSAYNVVSTRCAAEYLQMTEAVEKGNLVAKVELFFTSCVLHGWRDSIITLKNTKAFPVLSEDLGITSRCIEAIASQVMARPKKASSSHEYSRKGLDNGLCNESESHRHKSNTKGWWAEDVAELGIDLYWRTIIAIKSGGNVPSTLIGDALRIYASQWLQNISRYSYIARESESKHKLLLESIVSLLPEEKGAVSCSFLLKLLKAANMLKASSSSKIELARKVGRQLEEAKVSDLLVPSLSYTNGLKYDVDIVSTILEQFMIQGQNPPTSPPRTKGLDLERKRPNSSEIIEFQLQENKKSSSASHSSKLKVAKLVDGYLQEIARDENLALSKFIAIAEAIPVLARFDHDDLYKAIDIYLEGHPELNKSERRRLIRILDCKKLSVETCLHAAQNEMLPLRVVVQVLFISMLRSRPKRDLCLNGVNY